MADFHGVRDVCVGETCHSDGARTGVVRVSMSRMSCSTPPERTDEPHVRGGRPQDLRRSSLSGGSVHPPHRAERAWVGLEVLREAALPRACAEVRPFDPAASDVRVVG